MGAKRDQLLAESRSALIAEFFRLTRDAEAAREGETAASIRLQAVWRGHIVRRLVRDWHAGGLHIERVYRGHLGRTEAHRVRRQRRIYWQQVYFSQCATAVQKWFRGYHSRRYKHNYYARKAYVSAVLERSEAVREELEEQLRAQVDATVAAQEQDARDKVQHLSAKLHHLVSTKTMPGIYNSPMHDGFLPTAFSIPVEQHLRNAIKPQLREEAALRAKGKLKNTRPDMSALKERGRREPEPYRTHDEARRAETRSSKAGFIAGPFHTATSQRESFSGPHVSLHTGTPYIDGGMHTISRETKKTSWVSSKPFHTTVPSNRLLETQR